MTGIIVLAVMCLFPFGIIGLYISDVRAINRDARRRVLLRVTRQYHREEHNEQHNDHTYDGKVKFSRNLREKA